MKSKSASDRANKVVFFLLAIVLRAALIYIAHIVDTTSTTNKYTDTDYEVFTDAARHVSNAGSPYARHTYRYTPLAAYICLPNIWIHPLAGKVIFCTFDILMGIIYWAFVESQLESTFSKTFDSMVFNALYLFNPLIFILSTRGSNDNIISMLVFIAMFCLLKRKYALAGFFFGLSVHFKIYPIIYSFVFYLYIDMDRAMIAKGHPFKAITSQFSFFSRNRLVFTAWAAGTFIGFTAFFYYVYGWEFLHESLLYHLVRKDHRHNNSVYFYLIYMLYDEPSSALLSLATFIPQWGLVFVIGVLFYYDLFFVMTIQTWAFVIFNKVVTAQYYLWFMALLPIMLINSELAREKKTHLVAIFAALAVCQGIWGYFAHNFEHFFADYILEI
jgi:GPI mannosyltransferase 1 subunit M